MLKISQLKLDVRKLPVTEETRKVDYAAERALLQKELLKMLRIPEADLLDFHIVKKSIDARKKEDIKYIYVLAAKVKKENQILRKLKNSNVSVYERKQYSFTPKGTKKLKHPPVIIGMGPAGLFCALELAKAGMKPIVFERGKAVEERVKDVEHFWKTGELNTESNVQFGEGGAGTFSDGKLNTAVKDPTGRVQKVLDTFAEYGAPQEVKYLNKPHIGTNRLQGIVKNMREEITSLGGQVHFSSKLTDILIENGKVTGVVINDKKIVPCEALVLALGHSARDTFSVLHEKGLDMQKKAFAIGVRVEHPQDLINHSQYGSEFALLPTADYKLTHQASNGRGVYSFCMCPGGYVVNSSSEEGRLVVNGMSNYERDARNSNSALIVTVTPDDFMGDSVLAGVEFQRKWEEAAYKAGNGKVPVQLYGDFKENRISTEFKMVKPCMKGETAFANVRECLPDYVSETIIEGMTAFDKKIKGYDDKDAIISGVETRTSSPVRIVRNEALESNIQGIFPCGEGAGYAGGITSAAMDGIKIHEAILNQFCI
ncbi:MAG TPA: FAD-dependent oxidoreductase [Lachnospiraceae bacterium]|nr:NAD(P)/FAD-dependent oxidoreductase [uncultured Lachnoclostridium sp.]HAU84117.1 FAD-dependent oxidoreductase [Lachnospiraceae bacterium]